VGNAIRNGANTRDWFVGPFLSPDTGIRASSDLEIKWVTNQSNDRRAQLVTDETRTTVLILIKGRCRIELSAGSFVLSEPGDYAMWGPGIDHTWESPTIRRSSPSAGGPHHHRPIKKRPTSTAELRAERSA
jgi:hypothetical protein